MRGFFELKRDVFLKHGSGSTDLASAIIHLEEENNELIRDIANRDISILALGNQADELLEENKKLLHIIETTARKLQS